MNKGYPWKALFSSDMFLMKMAERNTEYKPEIAINHTSSFEISESSVESLCESRERHSPNYQKASMSGKQCLQLTAKIRHSHNRH